MWPLGWRRALKSSHVSLSAIWLGAALALVILALPGASVVGERIAGVTFCMTLIDDLVIIPTATAVVLSGLLYGWKTKWGFVRFDWVIVKWVSTLLFVGFGALFLGPWIDSMDGLARESGAAAFDDPGFLSARRAVILWGAIQTLALVGLVFISIFKPWGRRSGVDPAR